MFWLFILGIIVIIVLLSNTGKKKDLERTSQLSARNQQWIDFIIGYGAVVQSAKEKALVQRMLDDITAQGLGIVPRTSRDKLPEQTSVKPIQATVAQSVVQQAAAVNEAPSKEPSVQMDNASVLLYFGAFLFVASGGLFVAFGGASGGVKTTIVLLVSIIMYSFGIWLYKTKPKLRQAGLAFTGIGIVLAPLVGATLYAYVFNHGNGGLAWLLTSVFCLGLYAHALKVLKTPLMSYVFIFTFLSLFESGVGVAAAPIYYYGWGLAFVGILLQLLHQLKGYWPELQESSRQSSQIMLPLAVIASIALVPEHGALQLGVSLLLAATFYGLETLRGHGFEREADAVFSQVSAIAASAAIAYGISSDWRTVALTVLCVNVLQLLVVVFAGSASRLWHNFASILSVAAIMNILLALESPRVLLATVTTAVIIGTVLWLKQKRADAYAIASLAWMSLPYVFGQLVMINPMSAKIQAVWGFAALLLLLVAFIYYSSKVKDILEWPGFAGATYVVGAVSVIMAAAVAGPLICLIMAGCLVASFIVLAEVEHNPEWAEVSAILFAAPVLRSWNDPAVLLLSSVSAQLLYIGLSLRYRREMLRWASTLIWLLLPVAFGRFDLGGHWGVEAYAWSYVAAMFGLILSRAIARGVVLMSSKIPMSSFARSASMSYVVGYIAAAILAVSLSIAVDNSRLHTSAILAVVVLALIILSRYVEKRLDILALLPLLLQGLWLSCVRPEQSGQSLQIFLGGSIVLAVLTYAVSEYARSRDDKNIAELTAVVTVALLTSFFAPISVIFMEKDTWLMAIGLLVAGTLLGYHLRKNREAYRELAGGVIALSIWWMMSLAGIHALQAYVHVLVATFGLYAYIRTKLLDNNVANQYLWCMLATATVPLAIQAIGGSAGGLYGWWLLLEQVVIMLIGMLIGKSFVTRWGLYVAVAAVLYQLRGLGYAALAALALFLIGLAIFELQKHSDNK